MSQNYQWREITSSEFPLIRTMLKATLADEAYYTLPADASDEDMHNYWFSGINNRVWVLEEKGVVLGAFNQRANQAGLASHIANGAYMVAPEGRGKGIGRILGVKSLEIARERGFRGIQFNFVVSSNSHAVALWRSLGFIVIGTIPGAFHFKKQRYDDALIMFKDLTI